MSEAVRRCILSGAHDDREALLRLALGPDGTVAPDVLARAPGRGAWIGVSRHELEAAMRKGRLRPALARAFKGPAPLVPDDLGARIEDALQRALCDRLGLEARAGHLISGSAKIEVAARRGEVALLLHASDAQPDGTRKLDQAWRVGSDAEGSDLAGTALPLDRQRLSVALGKENTVHVALIDGAAAHRVKVIADRLRRFAGPDPLTDGPSFDRPAPAPTAAVRDEAVSPVPGDATAVPP